MLETEDYEGELTKLRKLYEMVKHIDMVDKMEGVFFICGHGGDKDVNGLYDRIFICPTYGADWFQVYEKSDRTGK